ncbi:MAG: cytidylate kinase-like family protein [Marinilabiliaceae bacterium]|nr:cytidylate kinase-like family protein [Marinilabiliaceae bacterium]
MDNLFLKYMNERTGKPLDLATDSRPKGPVITISRDHGCFASHIAQTLAETLTHKNELSGKEGVWRVISKEIVEESAKELKLSPELTQNLTEYRTRGFFENIALFFSDSFYPGDVKVRNTIARFIYNVASEGNVIIIGRAAEAHTKNFQNAFHAKLVAPVEWRAIQISKFNNKNLSDAKKEAIEVDKRRKQFRNYFEKNRPDIDYFDTFFNTSTMSEDEIVEMITIAAETRGFV